MAGRPDGCRRRTGLGTLAKLAGLTQPAVARFEAGGTVPTLPVLERLARALGAELTVDLAPTSSVA